MNFASLFALLFPSLFDAAAAKVIHQVAGTHRGDDILQKNGAAIAAIKAVAQPYIAQQVAGHAAAMSAASGTINLGQFLPASVQGAVPDIHIHIGGLPQ